MYEEKVGESGWRERRGKEGRSVVKGMIEGGMERSKEKGRIMVEE